MPEPAAEMLCVIEGKYGAVIFVIMPDEPAAIEIPPADVFRQIVFIVFVPMLLGYFTKKWLIRRFGREWYQRDGITISTGTMSTVIAGERQTVFQAVSDGFARVSDQCNVVLHVKYSNACPSNFGESCMARCEQIKGASAAD